MSKSRATEDQLEPEGSKSRATEDPMGGEDTEGHMFQPADYGTNDRDSESHVTSLPEVCDA